MSLRYYIYTNTTSRLFFRLPGAGAYPHPAPPPTHHPPTPRGGLSHPHPHPEGLPHCHCLLSLTSTLHRGVKTPVYTGYTGTIHQYARCILDGLLAYILVQDNLHAENTDTYTISTNIYCTGKEIANHSETGLCKGIQKMLRGTHFLEPTLAPPVYR